MNVKTDNAQRSTGPRTEAGKPASRMNALTSGIHANPTASVARPRSPRFNSPRSIPPSSNQSPKLDLVDTLIDNQWLIRRPRLTEADLYALHFPAM